MKVELFDFQAASVEELRKKLAAARQENESSGIQQILSLQAPTGSGKTIIMSALMESVYEGDSDYPEQPEAIFVWLSDSPELNEQSRQKVELQSDLGFNKCVMINSESFDQEELDEGKIYFLNTQKLARDKGLVSHSDKRNFTIWETLANTAANPAKKLYFIIDEAHRGMKERDYRQAATIMQRFIKGSEEIPKMPLILGMSATAERFNALAGNQTDAAFRPTSVNPEDVKKSGLLKDTIIINYPKDNIKNDDMALLGAAALDWKQKCEQWKKYFQINKIKGFEPIFLIQVKDRTGNSISASNLDEIIRHIEDRTGFKFKEGEIAHTFDQSARIDANGITISHVRPSEINDISELRIVFFKENLSTGWDCPRAETMMSFRSAKDATNIAQILGRMVRTPKGKRIASDNSLNEVSLFLPYFDRENVRQIVDYLSSRENIFPSETRERETDDSIPVILTGQVPLAPKYKKDVKTGENRLGAAPILDLINIKESQRDVNNQDDNNLISQKIIAQNDLSLTQAPAEAGRNTAVTEDVEKEENDDKSQDLIKRTDIIEYIDKLALPTFRINSKKISNYLVPLFNLISCINRAYPSDNPVHPLKLAADEARKKVFSIIREYGNKLRNNDEFKKRAEKIENIELAQLSLSALGEEKITETQLTLFARSINLIERQWDAAENKFGKTGISRDYVKFFRASGTGSDFDKTTKAQLECILFSMDSEAMSDLKNNAAKDLFHALSSQARLDLLNAHARYQEEYDEIVSTADQVSRHNFILPETISSYSNSEGKKYNNHLLADENGLAQIKLNTWEEAVITREAQEEDFLCWLRNPDRKYWSLCVPYEMDGNTRPMYPDFLIIRQGKNGFLVDIIEPHRQSPDSLPKIKGLCKYARENNPRIGRLLFIDKSDTNLKSLDLMDPPIQEKVLALKTEDGLNDLIKSDGKQYCPCPLS